METLKDLIASGSVWAQDVGAGGANLREGGLGKREVLHQAWHLGRPQEGVALPSDLKRENFQDLRRRFITGQGGGLSGLWDHLLSIHVQRQPALL